MLSIQLLPSSYETTGLFKRTLNWLQHRNRLHAAAFCVAPAGAVQGPSSSRFSNVQAVFQSPRPHPRARRVAPVPPTAALAATADLPTAVPDHAAAGGVSSDNGGGRNVDGSSTASSGRKYWSLPHEEAAATPQHPADVLLAPAPRSARCRATAPDSPSPTTALESPHLHHHSSSSPPRSPQFMLSARCEAAAAASPPPPLPGFGAATAGPAPARLSSADLSTAIRAAASLDELAELYEGLHGSFRSGHVSATLSRMTRAAELCHTSKPRLPDARHEWLLEELLRRFEAHRTAGEYGTRDLSACAWVLGLLGRRERAGTVAALSAHMLALRRRYRVQQQEAKELEAERKRQQRQALRAGPGEKSDAAVTTEAAAPAEAAAAAAAAAPAGVAATAVIAAAAPGRLSDCNPQDLSNMALGMAKAGVTDSELWRQLAEAAEQQLTAFGTQEAANFAWSLAKAHRAYGRCHPVPAAAGSGAGGRVAGDGGGGAEEERAGEGHLGDVGSVGPVLHSDWQPWLGTFVEGVLAPRARRTLRRYTGQQVANMAWALAALGHSDRRTVAVVAAEAEARAAGLAPQGVCLLVWAMATMVQADCSSSSGSSGRTSDSSGSDGSGEPQTPYQGTVRLGLQQQQQQEQPQQQRAHQGQGTHQKEEEEGPVVSRRALRALALSAARSIHRFSAQGLSNLLWGLRSLGFRCSTHLMALAAREAVLRLEEMQPLGLATLLSDWAGAGMYHPALFAAAAPAVASRLGEFRPRTLARVVCAYGAVGHADARLFRAAACWLLLPAPAINPAAGSSSSRHAGADFGQPPQQQQRSRSIHLDELSPTQLYQVACAYGQAGVHAPELMDQLLVRMAPAVVAGQGQGGGGSLSPRAACRLASALAVLGHHPAAADAAAAAPVLRALRRLLLPVLASLEAPLAVTGVWALMRLGAVGAPAALRLAEALSRRTAGGFAAAVPSVLASPAVTADPRVLSRLVWVLGRGAAAAAAVESAEQQLGARHVAAPRSGADGAAAAAEASAAAVELTRGLLGVADVLVEERLESLNGGLLAALTEALAAVLAATPRASKGRGAGGSTALYDRLYESFMAVVEQALRRAAAPAPVSSSAAFATAATRPPGRLSARDLASVVHAMYDSSAVAGQPMMRAAAARQVLRALQAATAVISGQPPPPPAASRHDGPAQPHHSKPLWPQRPQQQQLPPGLSRDDLAGLMAAAARLELYDQPFALPVLLGAARCLFQESDPGFGGVSDSGGLPVGPWGLQEVLRHCRPAAPRAGGEGRRAHVLLHAAASGDGRALLRVVYGWAARQALPVLPWLADDARARVVEEVGAGALAVAAVGRQEQEQRGKAMDTGMLAARMCKDVESGSDAENDPRVAAAPSVSVGPRMEADSLRAASCPAGEGVLEELERAARSGTDPQSAATYGGTQEGGATRKVSARGGGGVVSDVVVGAGSPGSRRRAGPGLSGAAPLLAGGAGAGVTAFVGQTGDGTTGRNGAVLRVGMDVVVVCPEGVHECIRAPPLGRVAAHA